MRRVLLTGLVALAAVAALTHVSSAAPVAMASDLSGQPQVRTASGGDWAPLHLCARLSPGDTVRCGEGATATIMMFANGSRYKIAAHGKGVVAEGGVTGGQSVAALGGPSVQVASAMTGSRLDAFLTRATPMHERIVKDFPGYFIDGTTHFDFLPIDGAVSYNFTVFDRFDNVVYAAHTADTTVDASADGVDFGTRRPYVWTLTGMGSGGKPVPGGRWGIITFLSQDDADTLQSQASNLKGQIASSTNSADTTTETLLLAELYRSYGVVNNALETLEPPQPINKKPGVADLISSCYQDAGTLAVAFYEGHAPGSSSN